MRTLPIGTVTVTIDAPFERVASFIADPARAHEWGTEFFDGPLRPGMDDEWVAMVPMMGGKVRYRHDSDLEYGHIDIYLAPDGAPFGPPLAVRMLHNGDGADVLWTLTRFPGTSDEVWQGMLASMQRELNQLKEILEAG